VNLPLADEGDVYPPPPPRIASLVPSLTELVCALELGPYLVARTGYCIHPAAQVERVPKVGGTKTVNLAKLARIAPSHVIVNIDENRLDTVQALEALGVELIVTHPAAPEDNLALIDQVAAPFLALPQVAEAAQGLRAAFVRALAETAVVPNRLVRSDAQAWSTPVSERVLYLIWRDPWMTVARDTYLSRMLARIGWHTWPDVHGGDRGAARYPVVSGDEPWLDTIDRVLLSSEPFAFDAIHEAEAARLCPNARIQPIDGEALSWYGPRALKGLSLLQQLGASMHAK
jgi:ABC-type Fe3+-hydroxamate transport system substrate-binding protein